MTKTYNQQEIDQLIDAANDLNKTPKRLWCEHPEKRYSSYGPDNQLVICQVCRFMFVEMNEEITEGEKSEIKARR